MRPTIASQAVRSGTAVSSRAARRPRGRAPGRGSGAGSRRSRRRPGLSTTQSKSTLQKKAILRLMSAEMACSLRQMRMSGWRPICINSRTECWVGLVLSSPAAAMKGTRVRWMTRGVVASDLLAELPDGLEERQRLDVAHGATDLGDHHVVPGAVRRMAFLISSVMWGMTWTVLPGIRPDAPC